MMSNMTSEHGPFFPPGCIPGNVNYQLCIDAINASNGKFVPGGFEMTSDRLLRNLTGFIASFILFAGCFFISHDKPFSHTWAASL